MKIFLLLSFALHVSISNGMVIKKDSSASRREFIEKSALIAGGVVQAWGYDSQPASAEEILPFCVIGANGRTGTKCVQGLLDRQIPVRATSRSGLYTEDPDSKNPLLIPTICDVTIQSTIESAVVGSKAVIFAASASKAGGTPAQVDNDGLVNVAKACIDAKVPHLVIVSSGGVSKPDSPVYKFLNIFGGIMEQKIKGEDTVRRMYAGLEGMTYTVVRPGGLTEEPPLGVGGLELNQGDIKSGRISRFDVASLCIESTLYPSVTGQTTFECYNADTGKSLGTVGMSNIMKQKSTEPDVVTGFERRGDTFEKLFTGLRKDA
jgi:uncharacterized protein YbjT (DUF2867 family)